MQYSSKIQDVKQTLCKIPEKSEIIRRNNLVEFVKRFQTIFSYHAVLTRPHWWGRRQEETLANGPKNGENIKNENTRLLR